MAGKTQAQKAIHKFIVMKNISAIAAVAIIFSSQTASSLTTKEKADLTEVAESYEDCVVGAYTFIYIYIYIYIYI